MKEKVSPILKASIRDDKTRGVKHIRAFLGSCNFYRRYIPTFLGGSGCMVKNEGKGRKMTGFQRHQKIVVLMDILKPSQTSMAE